MMTILCFVLQIRMAAYNKVDSDYNCWNLVCVLQIRMAAYNKMMKCWFFCS